MTTGRINQVASFPNHRIATPRATAKTWRSQHAASIRRSFPQPKRKPSGFGFVGGRPSLVEDDYLLAPTGRECTPRSTTDFRILREQSLGRAQTPQSTAIDRAASSSDRNAVLFCASCAPISLWRRTTALVMSTSSARLRAHCSSAIRLALRNGQPTSLANAAIHRS